MDVKPYKLPHPFKKLSKKLIDSLCSDIEKGSTACYACESHGITEKIFYVWINQGRVDIELQLDTLPATLVQSLAKIRNKEVQKCRKLILSSDKGHKGAEWTLEHAYWRQFGASAPVLQLAEEMEAFKQQFLKGNSNGEAEDVDKK